MIRTSTISQADELSTVIDLEDFLQALGIEVPEELRLEARASILGGTKIEIEIIAIESDDA